MKTIILTLLLALSFSSQAGMITTKLEQTQVAANDSLSVEITGSGFAPSDIFWFDLVFDTGLFALDLNSVTSSLNLVNKAAGLFDGLEIIERSFGLGFTFSDPTPVSGNFTIAKFQLTALKSGASDFKVSGIDGFNLDFSTPTYSTAFSNGQNVAVAAANVSESSSFALLLLSIAGFVLVNRKQQNNTSF